MKILFINEANPEGQDQFADSLLYGFVRAFGSQNVAEFFTHRRYCSDPEYLKPWPVHLAALTYGCWQNAPLPPGRDLTQWDAWVINTRALHDQWVAEAMQKMDPRKVVIISSGDGPERPLLPFAAPPALIVHRPGNAWPGNFRNLELFISVPNEWVRYHLAQGDKRPHTWKVYACMSDNHPKRREVIQALVGRVSCLCRFGSGSGFKIEGAYPGVAIPDFLREIEGAKVVVNCRGGGLDTMMVSETLILNRLLITDHFGGEAYKHREHLLYYEDPAEAVDQANWALANPSNAEEIANAGHNHHQMHDRPEIQAVRIMREARLL